MTEGEERAKTGLRERKKAKTRSTIQHHALRLFREQGYHETTIEQIADASDVSPSTLFRYFPTKEALVLEDEFDPMIIERFRKQPLELNPVQAFRGAMRTIAAQMPEEQRKEVRDRLTLAMAYPELRAASLANMSDAMTMIAGLIGERLGRSGDDMFALAYSGAIVGAVLSAHYYCSQHTEADFIDAMDEGLAYLENDFRLAPPASEGKE